MPHQELLAEDLKVAEDSRYTEDEYRQIKSVAEQENRDPAELLDTTTTVALEARTNHRKAYKHLLQSILPSQVEDADLETLEETFFTVFKR